MTVKLDMFLHKLAQGRSRLAILLLPAIFCILFLAFSARSVPLEDNEIAPVDRKNKESPVWDLEEKDEEKDLTLNQDGARIPLNDDSDNQEEQPAEKGKLISTMDGEAEKEQEEGEKKEKVEEQDDKVDRFEMALDKEKDGKETPTEEKREDGENDKDDNGETMRDSVEPVDIKKGIPNEEKEKLTEDEEKKEEVIDKMEKDGDIDEKTDKKEDDAGETPTKEETLKGDDDNKAEDGGEEKKTEESKEIRVDSEQKAEEGEKPVDEKNAEETLVEGKEETKADETENETIKDSEVVASEAKGELHEAAETCEDGEKENCKKEDGEEKKEDERKEEPVLIPSVLDAPRQTEEGHQEAGENVEQPENKPENADDGGETAVKDGKIEGITPLAQVDKGLDGTEDKQEAVDDEKNETNQDNSTVAVGEEVKPDEEEKPEEPTTLVSQQGVGEKGEEQLEKISKATTQSLLEDDLVDKKGEEKKKTSGRSRKSRKIVHDKDVEGKQNEATTSEPEKKLNLEEIIMKAKKAMREDSGPREGEKPEESFPEEHQLAPKDPLAAE